jgi:hypothetical protein
LTDGQLSYVHAYGSKHFPHKLFSAHVVISCAYGSYRLREFEFEYKYKGLILRALFLGEMRIISPVSFELRLLE